MKDLWFVWFTPYQTYNEETVNGIQRACIVAGPFSFAAALQKLEGKTYEFCIKPMPERNGK